MFKCPNGFCHIWLPREERPSPFRLDGGARYHPTTHILRYCDIVSSPLVNPRAVLDMSSTLRGQRTGGPLLRTGDRHRRARYHHATTLTASKTCNQHHHCTTTPSSHQITPFTQHHPTTAPLHHIPTTTALYPSTNPHLTTNHITSHHLLCKYRLAPTPEPVSVPFLPSRPVHLAKLIIKLEIMSAPEVM